MIDLNNMTEVKAAREADYQAELATIDQTDTFAAHWAGSRTNVPASMHAHGMWAIETAAGPSPSPSHAPGSSPGSPLDTLRTGAGCWRATCHPRRCLRSCLS